MSQPKQKSDERYTYADYLTWPDDERWEIIDGVAYSMSPSPLVEHQRVSRILSRIIDTHLLGRQCELFSAPFDVRLSANKQQSDNYIETVVQPDIIVVCDPLKIDRRGCNGAPDLVIEILSPSTGGKDLTIKYDLYEQHGVKEYWIIHPAERTLLVFKLDKNGKYGAADRYAGDAKVPVPLLGEFVIDLAEVFAE
jgi:Uma2 family endonuclease